MTEMELSGWVELPNSDELRNLYVLSTKTDTQARRKLSHFFEIRRDGSTFHPELDYEGILALAKAADSPKLAENAKAIVEANRAYVEILAPEFGGWTVAGASHYGNPRGSGRVETAASRDRRQKVSREFLEYASDAFQDLEKHLAELEALAKQLSNAKDEDRRQLESEIKELKEKIETIEGMIAAQLDRSGRLEDHGASGEVLISLRDSATIEKLATSTLVSIYDETSRIGSGFTYRGRVITCAHLFGSDKYWTKKPGGVVERLDEKLSKVRVFRYLNGSWSGAIAIDWKSSTIDKDHDLACLKPAVDVLGSATAPSPSSSPGPGRAATPSLHYNDDPGRAQIGTLTLYTPWLFEGKLGISKVPGRIVFAVVVEFPEARATRGRRSHGYGNPGDHNFWRAVRNQYAATPMNLTTGLSRNTTPILEAVKAVKKEYNGCTRPKPCLTAPLKGSPKRIVCFGSHYRTEPLEGMSGAPVFRIVGNQLFLVGIHSGQIGTAKYGIPPSFKDFARAIPFHYVKEIIDAWIKNEP